MPEQISTTILKALEQNSARLMRLEDMLSFPEGTDEDPIQQLLDRQERIEQLILEMIDVLDDLAPE
ncbi:hypothetical protein ACXYMW_00450 [Roseivivax sp. CAU 1761]